MNEPVAVFPPLTPEAAALEPKEPRREPELPVPRAPAGIVVELTPEGRATLEAHALLVAVLVPCEYFVWAVPRMVKLFVLAEDAAGSNDQNRRLDTVYATEFVQ
jgi:hypothetical protein